MKTITKTIFLSAITLGLAACGDSDIKTTPPQIDTMESGWQLTNNGKVYLGGIFEGQFYGAGYEGDFAYGIASETDNGLHLMLTTDSGSIANELKKVSNDKYSFEDYTLDRNRFGYRNRNMFIKNANWYSEQTSTPLNVNDQGQFFNLVMKDTGCSIDGTLSYKENNLFVINGEAVGCIDGAYEGEVIAVGTARGHMMQETIEMRLLSALFVYEGDSSIDNKYHPTQFVIRN